MADWASHCVADLLAGKVTHCRPHGWSMMPRVKSGQLCTLAPVTGDVSVGDVVLCKVKGRSLLHLVSAIDRDRVQISNNHGRVNGWTSRRQIYGKLVAVED